MAKGKVIINKPLNWTALQLSEAVKSLVFEADKDNNLKALPVIVIDPAKSSPDSATSINIADPTTPATKATVTNVQGGIPYGAPALVTLGIMNLFNPATFLYEPPRTPTVFKNITTLANGSTAIWTSGVGKKWRLMGISITLMQGTTAAAACALKMLDVAADTGVGVTICIAAMTAVLNATNVLNISFGNGIVAAATNTALNVNLSSVLAVGGVTVQVWGTEE